MPAGHAPQDRAIARSSEEEPRSTATAELLAKASHAVWWSYGATLARAAVQVGVNVALARLLGPNALGVYAIGAVSIGLVHIVTDLGLGTAMIQRRELRSEQLRAAFTLLFIVGAVSTAGLWSFADAIAKLSGDPRAATVIRWASPVMLLYPLLAVSSVALSRELDQRFLQLSSLVAYVLGFAVVGGIGAMLDLGPVALATALLGQVLVQTIILYWRARPPIRPLFSLSPLSGLRSFAWRVVGTSVANFLNEGLDNIWVGRVFGAHAMGVYSTGYNFVRMPVQHLVASLQAVLFPATAKVQEDTRRLSIGYLAILNAASIVGFPFFIAILVLREPLVGAVYGSKWSELTRFLVPFALAMPFQLLVAVSGPILWGIGLVGRELRIQVATTIALLAAVLLASQVSAYAVAWAAALVMGARALGLVTVVALRLNIPLSKVGATLRGGVVLSAMVVLASLLCEQAPQLRTLHPLLQLGISTAWVGAVGLVSIWYGRDWLIGSDLRSLIERMPRRSVVHRIWRLGRSAG